MPSTIGSSLQECPHCGYVAADLAEGDERDRLFAQSERYAALCELPQFSRRSSRFLLRAAIELARGDFERAFDSTLCAAADADDCDLSDIARGLRTIAGRYLAGRALTVDLRLRLLDVLRRASDWTAATVLAGKMMAENLAHPHAAIIRFQLGRIEARDDRCYTLSQALRSDHDPEASNDDAEHLDHVVHVLGRLKRR
ncbi:hypothetical protein [Bradyrhizobium sp. 199]|uniref:hypothetical protein n=1 Tax=Bradyrhizobium sp. 199 TaxID=2782664 RepID=UPI001FF7E6FA|nr:hypothetical protein [Bradyrhizobium sp. 199]MCK1362656.1 hypothetical protein [Bradyrhizobium sp. 199]